MAPMLSLRRWEAAGATAALLLPSMCAASSIAAGASHRPYVSSSAADDGFAALRMGKDNHGKLDIFLDLAEPGSSAAWPTLKNAVQDFRDRVEFVFHVNLLPSDSPIAQTVSKAAYLVGTRGKEEETEAFLDQVFGNQALFLEGSEDEIIDNWATASGTTFDLFNIVSSEGDPTLDEQVARSLSTTAPPLVGMRPTAVYLDGILMTYLDESVNEVASMSFLDST